MQRELTNSRIRDAEFIEEMKRVQEVFRSEIRGAERAVEYIAERGEEYPGEISRHLSDLDELRPREWFAGALVSILTEGKLPEVKRPMKKRLRVDGQITDFMIEAARSYPIENLIQVSRGKMARCISPDHTDKNPSMDIRNNFCYCYSCHFSADAIKVYQILNNCTFPEAVRALNV